VHKNQGGLELNETHQLLAYFDVNLLGKNINTIKKNTEKSLSRSKHR